MNKKTTKSDLVRLDALRDEDIDYSDSPELDDSFFEKSTGQYPHPDKDIGQLEGIIQAQASLARGEGIPFDAVMEEMDALIRQHDKQAP